jgi:alkaline phosphatase D
MFLAGLAPAFVRAARPSVQGVQTGDVTGGRAIVWSRSDRPSRMSVEWSTVESMAHARRVQGSWAAPEDGFTARVDLSGLPAGQRIFYRVSFQDGRDVSEPERGSFLSAPSAGRDIRFFWSGDTAGQGYGINPGFGGMKIYDTMRRAAPDFFIHSGDTIYADGPIPPEIVLPDGSIWKNVTTEAKSRPAETLDDFRGAYEYNLLDVNVRAFNAAVPQIWQWDDHELTNNWSPSKDLSRYREKDLHTLVRRARKAFLEFAPLRFSNVDRDRIYRRIPYGPLLDIFVVDMRSYRGPNTENRQESESAESAFLGKPQFEWLARDLARSRAAWKIVAADMPLGLIVGDGSSVHGRPMFEAVANGDGPPLGRELEIAALLRRLARNRVRNVVWLTADVHYTAAHYYDPAKAVFRDFDPFWEFVSGPLHAGTFGPAVLDDTFGPRAVFYKAPPKGQANLPPSAGMQFFGEVRIEASTKSMTVTLRDMAGTALHEQRLANG